MKTEDKMRIERKGDCKLSAEKNSEIVYGIFLGVLSFIVFSFLLFKFEYIPFVSLGVNTIVSLFLYFSANLKKAANAYGFLTIVSFLILMFIDQMMRGV